MADVGYQKITTDKASDANLLDANPAFQPLTRRSRSNARRGPHVPASDAEVARRRPRVPMPNADLASSVRREGRIPISDAKVARRGSRILYQTRRSSDAEVAFQFKREPEQLRVPTQTRACELRVSTSE